LAWKNVRTMRIKWEEFERLTKRDREPKSLSKFFAESPLAKVSIDLERKPNFGRPVEL
jgi:hypothetical protein